MKKLFLVLSLFAMSAMHADDDDDSSSSCREQDDIAYEGEVNADYGRSPNPDGPGRLPNPGGPRRVPNRAGTGR